MKEPGKRRVFSLARPHPIFVGRAVPGGTLCVSANHGGHGPPHGFDVAPRRRGCGIRQRPLESADPQKRGAAMATERYALKVPGAKSASPDLTVVAPFDRQPIATVATADAATVEHALAT